MRGAARERSGSDANPVASQVAQGSSSNLVKLKTGITVGGIQAAVDTANDGDVIKLPPNATIAVTSTILVDICRRSLTIDLNGSTLRQASEGEVIHAEGCHPWIRPATISTVGGVTHIAFKRTPSGLAVGDWVKVIADDPLPGATHGEKNQVRLGQAMRVAAITRGSVTLAGTLHNADGYVTNVRASVYRSGRLRIENGSVLGDQTHGDWKTPLVKIDTAIAPVVANLFIRDGNSMALHIGDSINARIENVDVRNLLDNTRDGNFGYGIHSGTSLNTMAEGVYCEKLRHCGDNNSTSVAADSSNVRAYGADIGFVLRDSVCYGATSACWSWHSEGNYGVYERVYAFDTYQCGNARGLNNTIRDSVCVGAKNGQQLHRYGNDGLSDARNLLFERYFIREIDDLGVFVAGHPMSNVMRDSRVESYGKATTAGKSLTLVNTPTISNVATDDDTMTGTAGADLLFSGAGLDNVDGEGGNDIIWGGQGPDSLTGGPGSDRFMYLLPSEGQDVITDFQAGAGGDVIDLGPFLSKVGYRGGDAVAAGYVRMIQIGSDAVLEVSANGQGIDWAKLATLRGVSVNLLTRDNWRMTLR